MSAVKHLSSRDNQLVKHLHGLASSGRERRKTGETLLDGAHLLAAALDAGLEIKSIVVSESGHAKPEVAGLLDRATDTPLICLPDPLFAHVSPVETPSGLLALIDMPRAATPASFAGSVILLEGVQDAGNLGTILRTAAAAGVGFALLTEGCAQAWSPKVLRAGMGAHFAMRIIERVDAAQAVARFSGEVLATGLGGGATALFECDLRGPIMWLFGAEGGGLSDAVQRLATARVSIPMPGRVESLNVAAAAAICLFEQVRQGGR